MILKKKYDDIRQCDVGEFARERDVDASEVVAAVDETSEDGLKEMRDDVDVLFLDVFAVIIIIVVVAVVVIVAVVVVFVIIITIALVSHDGRAGFFADEILLRLAPDERLAKIDGRLGTGRELGAS